MYLAHDLSDRGDQTIMQGSVILRPTISQPLA